MARKRRKKTAVAVVNDSGEPLEVIASAIVKLSKVAEAFQNSRLEERTIMLLMRDYTGLSMRHIKKVLDAIPLMADYYIKDPDDDA
ncbi:hypothetical protein LCGC14_1044020 [marine sediment metagenome]|uniref:Uncharacterized protein n=1 Tax=marine sediment metagenome TaxID=412755 RepID=A0A0F9MVB6_9ZZZZ